jgi:hypothetical protein
MLFVYYAEDADLSCMIFIFARRKGCRRYVGHRCRRCRHQHLGWVPYGVEKDGFLGMIVGIALLRPYRG